MFVKYYAPNGHAGPPGQWITDITVHLTKQCIIKQDLKKKNADIIQSYKPYSLIY